MAGPGRPGRPRSSAPAPSTRGRGRGRPPGRPPGRPRQRRDSNSTVASVEAGAIQYSPETTILNLTEIIDPDDWPCFVLKDAVVYRSTADGRLQIANVCNVDLEGPFIIRGKLEIDPDEHEQYLRQSDMRTAYIEISASVSYSIGYGPWPVVWAAGRAGWFELNPAAEYAAMYDTMCEGISLYYLAMDVYLESYKKAPKAKKAKLLNAPLDRVLFQYAIASGDGLTLPEAKQRVQKHAVFLLSHFPKEQDIDWLNTSLGKWLAKENKELENKIADAIVRKRDAAAAGQLPMPPPSELSPESGLDRKTEPELLTTKQSDHQDIEMEDAQPGQLIHPPRTITPILPPRPGQVPSAPGAVPFIPPVPNMGIAQPQLEDPVKFLLEFFEEVLERQGGDVGKVKETTIHSYMYLKCSIKEYHAARHVTHYYAKRLVASLNPKWYGSPFFQWLKARRDEPWEPTLLKEEEVPGQCVRRKKASTANRPKEPVGGKHPMGPRPSGKIAVLRPGGSVKRPFLAEDYEDGGEDGDEDEYDDSDDGRPPKIARTSSSDDSDDEEGIDLGSDAASASIPYSNTHIPVPVIPKETVRVVVRSEKLPSMSPVGINGTWKCQEEECSFIVRAAHTAEGQETISEHFKEHTTRADKINLALSEGTRGHLPINHLLDKIRTLGESSKSNVKNETDDPAEYPDPIKRRLLI